MSKEEIKTQLKKDMERQIDEFVDAITDELSKEKFNMSNVEEAIGKSLNEYHNKVMDTTEKIFNTKLETELVAKKKQNGKNKDIT